jgi:hypothetical protein
VKVAMGSLSFETVQDASLDAFLVLLLMIFC